MGIRQTLNEKKGLTAAVAGGVVVIAIALMAYNLSGPGAPSASEAYYTTDDGQSYFGGSVKDVPPFQKDGKTAVRAHVYRCTKCGKTFVNHLERYTPEAQKVLATAYASASNEPPANMGEIQNAQMNGAEFKKVGDSKWVSIRDRANVSKATAPTCPTGDGGEVMPLNP